MLLTANNELHQTAKTLNTYLPSHPRLDEKAETFQSGHALLSRIEMATEFK
ncbi:MAG: hypothetical protein ACOYJZ_04510 [Acutalibacter sp.]|jgi:hypothetical protein